MKKNYLIKEIDGELGGYYNKLLITLPEQVKLDIKNEVCFIIGGAVRSYFDNTKLKDIDIFYINKDAFNNTLNIVRKTNNDILSIENNFIKFKYNNEIDLCYLENVEGIVGILDKSDFIISKMSFYKGVLVHHKDCFSDINNKRLVYSGSDNPGGSLIRQFSFVEKGYSIEKKELEKIYDDIRKEYI